MRLQNQHRGSTPNPLHRRRLRLERLVDRRLLAGDLTNEINPLDVNADEAVTPRDALAVINHLTRAEAISSTAEGESAPVPGQLYLDVNADDAVTALDALVVINGLTRLAQEAPPVAAASSHSGDAHVDVQVKGKDVHLKIRGEEETVYLSGLPGGMMQVSYGKGQTTNVPLRDDLIIHMDGSELAVQIGGFSMMGTSNDEPYDDYLTQGINVPDDLIVHAEGHEIAFEMIGSRVGDNLIYHGAEGDDRVQIAESQINSLLKIHTDDGNDIVRLGHTGQVMRDEVPMESGVRVGDDLIINLGDGNDLMSLRRVDVGDDGKIHGGHGNDLLLHEFLSVHDDLFVDGQHGDDELLARYVDVGDDAHLKMGHGEDFAELLNVIVDDVAHVDGGDDFDQLDAALSTIDVGKLHVRRFEQQSIS
ncbi:MAG: dockerin type I domain-containing protein [Planctomycetota bacterium]